jgi:hypothetical protein
MVSAVVSQTLSVRSKIFVAALAASVITGLPAAARSSYPAHTPVSEVTRPPIGWVEFCVEYYPSLIDPQPVTATATGLFGILRPRTHD